MLDYLLNSLSHLRHTHHPEASRGLGSGLGSGLGPWERGLKESDVPAP